MQRQLCVVDALYLCSSSSCKNGGRKDGEMQGTMQRMRQRQQQQHLQERTYQVCPLLYGVCGVSGIGDAAHLEQQHHR